jgi:asparagine synthase (glutamine-hydrolysing)
MCGIVGFASTSKKFILDEIKKSAENLFHRGPDDSGDWLSDNGCVCLAHRRLSILDISISGHQPMHNPLKGLTIIFNGEIYNFKELRNELTNLGHLFVSQSDTEVLLAAYAEWGCECLSKLNGMFAFALYDANLNQLFLARDRAGEKPLFYLKDSNSLYFASELKALLSLPNLPRDINFESLDCYLAIGYVPGNRCILDGFNKLPPAHAMTFHISTGFLNIWRYWQLPEIETSFQKYNDDDLLDELEDLLQDSVKRQMIADVPVGILLSGGVDSSLITAMAVRNSTKVKTFSIGFPGHGKLDETPHARLIADYFSTDHTELLAEPLSADLIPRLAIYFDEPIIDSSLIPTWLVSNLVRQHCKVALGGDGGDELFGGYNGYSRLLWMYSRLKYIPLPFRQLISGAAEHILPVGLKGRNYLQGFNMDLDNSLPLLASYFDRKTRSELLKAFKKHKNVAEEIRRSSIPLNGDLLQRATRMDFQEYLAEDILVKVDRASMMNSLEIRAPLLDHRIIEFAFGKVPSRLKATEHEKKILLKRLTSKLLPPAFDQKRKQGFSIPLADWLKKGSYRDLFWDILTDRNCIFDKKTINKLLRGQDKGHSNGERLFGLLMFELWRREYHIIM